MKALRYAKHRKKLLIEYRDWLVKRDKVTKELRELRKELNAWDNGLINEDLR